MQQFSRFFWLVVVVVAFGVLFAVGCSSPKCGEDVNCVAQAAQGSEQYPREADQPQTGVVDQAVGTGKSWSKDLRYSAGWVWMYFWISILPVLAMLVPGSGRTEKFAEAAVFLILGSYFLWIVGKNDYPYLRLISWIMNILPGIGLLIWGLFSSGQSGKVKVFLGFPLAVNALACCLFLIGAVHALMIGSAIGLLVILAAKVLGLWVAVKAVT